MGFQRDTSLWWRFGVPEKTKAFWGKGSEAVPPRKNENKWDAGALPTLPHLADLQISKRFSARNAAKPVINWLKTKLSAKEETTWKAE
jgi:hypothetical protein